MEENRNKATAANVFLVGAGISPTQIAIKFIHRGCSVAKIDAQWCKHFRLWLQCHKFKTLIMMN